MNKLSLAIVVLVSGGLILASCSQVRQPFPTPELKAPAARVSPLPPGEPWEQKWNNILLEAKKEGSVTLYNTSWPPEIRSVLTPAFKEKYGINIEFSPFSRGAELLAKVQVEKRAGLNVADVFGAGGPTLISTMKPEGLLGPLEPLLILPEVIKPEVWSGGKLPFLDKDKLAIAMIASVSPYILYNTNLIKEGEITNYKDALKPQYKGKITLNDPTVTGAGNNFITFLATIWSLEEASDYLKQLIQQQGVVLQRDARLHVESVARGKFAIGLGLQQSSAAEFLNLGAPIGIVINKEGTFASPAAGCLAVSIQPAHPNAAVVFVNWLLSKEGQTVFSRNFGNPSIRNDVPIEGIHPIFLPQTWGKIYPDSEDLIIYRGKMQEITKKIIEEATK